jgi:ribosomal protein L40E
VATPGGGPEQPPSAEQGNAFRYLLEHEAAIRDTVVAAIWEEYWSVREQRLAGGGLASDMPALASSEQLKSHIGLSTIHILPVTKDNAAYIGFELGCTWEEEHGLGIMTHQGRIVELTDKGIAKVNQADLAFEEWVAEEDAQAPEPVDEEDLTIGEQLRRAGPHCSFCGQAPDKVGPLVEGVGLKNRGGVFICRSCVERLSGVFEEQTRRAATKVRECLRCHAVIPKDAATCPECGFPRL